MPSYEFLVERLFETHQIIVSLAAMGIALCVGLYILWGRYDELLSFLKDDGLQDRFVRYRIKKERARRAKRGECPSHGTPLKMYGGKCPVKDCKEDKA